MKSCAAVFLTTVIENIITYATIRHYTELSRPRVRMPPSFSSIIANSQQKKVVSKTTLHQRCLTPLVRIAPKVPDPSGTSRRIKNSLSVRKNQRHLSDGDVQRPVRPGQDPCFLREGLGHPDAGIIAVVILD